MAKDVVERESSSQLTSYEAFNTRSVVKTLEGLMNKVTQKECTAETVNAACNCADKITNILKVHLDVERIRKNFRK